MQQISELKEKRVVQSLHKACFLQTIYQQEQCFAITFNYTNKFIAASYNNTIVIWKFEEGNMEKVQELIGHDQNIRLLCFSRKDNLLVSACTSTIMVWDSYHDLWRAVVSLANMTNNLIFKILISNDNSIICGNQAGIDIWLKKETLSQWNLQQTLCKNVQTISFSLNSTGSQLTAFTLPNILIIWQKSKENKWKILQKLQNSITRGRVSFIGVNQILLEEYYGYAHKFSIDIKTNLYKQLNLLPIHLKNYYYFDNQSSYFLSIISDQQQLLIQKNRNTVYIFSFDLNLEFTLIQEITFKVCRNKHICGALTSDGRYLLVYKRDECQFIVYKLIYL